MSISRNTWLWVSFLALALVLSVGYKLFYPMGEGPQIDFPQTRRPPEELRQFLSGNFVIIDRVQSLPKAVGIAFTEAAGIRSTMANPGQRFEASDVILTPGTPGKRLILGGVYGDRCFVHHEQGGIAHSYDLEFFKLLSTNGAKPVWKGYCDRATDLNDLRDQLERGGCQSQ